MPTRLLGAGRLLVGRLHLVDRAVARLLRGGLVLLADPLRDRAELRVRPELEARDRDAAERVGVAAALEVVRELQRSRERGPVGVNMSRAAFASAWSRT